MTARKILRIDAERCNGCGRCASACAEGAIEMHDGKARLVKDSYCDGLGACIGGCPTGALTIEEREAAEFSAPHPPRGCPGSAVRILGPEAPTPSGAPAVSQLSNWPVQITLVPETASWLDGSDLLIAADCTPFAFADFHRRFVRGRSVLVGCPKLDDAASYIEKLAAIFARNDIRSVEVVFMQVPCCGGLVRVVRSAKEMAASSFPLRLTRIGMDGSILDSTVE